MQDIAQTAAPAAAADDADFGRGRRRASANPLAQVLGPFTRTGGFYARSWGTYLDREPGELPVAAAHHCACGAGVPRRNRAGRVSLAAVNPDARTLEWINREVIADLTLFRGICTRISA